MKLCDFSTLVGKTLLAIDRSDPKDDDVLTFRCDDGTIYRMYHEQDCCESVVIEDMCGEVDDLIGTPIVMAEERSHSGENGPHDDSYTWTFYLIATNRGTMTIRWHGTSNGYYNESVIFAEIEQ